MKPVKEAQKTNKIRTKDFFDKYFSGRVLDIGAGDDLICSSAERFDVEDGDANNITLYKKHEVYDTIHSSHCLEHMANPHHALTEWWMLLKPGGYLVLVVPDEDLYEQGIWPSAFNSDHKNTFTLKEGKSWSPASWNIRNLVSKLDGAEIISAEVQDEGYDYSLQTKPGAKIIAVNALTHRIFKSISRLLHFFSQMYGRKLDDCLFRLYNIPIDQTMREALAQIQVVAQKRG